MGTSMKRVEVVWDTGSEWLIVNSADCFTCNLGGYDTQTSSKFKFLPDTYGERVYGTAYTTGDELLDSVCITTLATSCASRIQMVLSRQPDWQRWHRWHSWDGIWIGT